MLKDVNTRNKELDTQLANGVSSIASEKIRLPIHYSQPNLTATAKAAALSVLDSRWIAGAGKVTRLYEDRMSEFAGGHALAVSNASIALEMCGMVLFNERLRTVRVPAMSFIASAMSFRRAGLGVMLVDMNESKWVTYSRDVSVSLAGYPLDRSGLVADDAHYVHPDMYGMGSYRFRVMSHHAIKPLTAGEGGTILCDEEDWKTLNKMRSHGRGEDGLAEIIGGNFRMTDMQAAILYAQMGTWEKDHKRRHEIAQRYRTALRGRVDMQPHSRKHAYHLFMIRVPAKHRDAIRKDMLDVGIHTQINYVPIGEHPVFSDITDPTPVAYKHYATCISLPMHAGLTDEEVEYVIQNLGRSLNKYEL
jgi:dTDP-4-amino-4,6-dideoxygalactose transaminase